jgi:sirohydrochlorin ferrochelatase
MNHVVLAAHGSRDPRSSATVRAIARAVAAARPDLVVHDAYLDFDAPHLATVLDALVDQRVTVVPLLLSAAYHARTDIPTIVRAARERGADVEIAEVLPDPRDGGFDLIVSALRRRLALAGSGFDGSGFDGLVLAAAGSRDAEALAGIEAVAAAFGRAEGRRCVTGYASGAGRPIAEAIEQVRAMGARNVGVAAYFVAPGRLYDRIVEAAAGTVVSRPLGDAPEIVSIVSRRTLTLTTV